MQGARGRLDNITCILTYNETTGCHDGTVTVTLHEAAMETESFDPLRIKTVYQTQPIAVGDRGSERIGGECNGLRDGAEVARTSLT